MGEFITLEEATASCDPIITNSDMNKNVSFDGTPLDGDKVAIPCGLIAKSMFTDNYTLSSTANFDNTGLIKIDDSDIAWKSDVDFKFKN